MSILPPLADRFIIQIDTDDGCRPHLGGGLFHFVDGNLLGAA
jgi:hypothetical protein